MKNLVFLAISTLLIIAIVIFSFILFNPPPAKFDPCSEYGDALSSFVINKNSTADWRHYDSLYFAGLLNVYANHEFTVTLKSGKFVAKSEKLMSENNTPVYVATFDADPTEFYRVTSDVKIFSETENKVFFICDPQNDKILP